MTEKIRSIPGWNITVNEIANNVYRMTATDLYGRKAEVTNTDIDIAIEEVLNFALDIEKQVSENWGSYVYKLVLQLLDDNSRSISHELTHQFWYVASLYKKISYQYDNAAITVLEFSGDVWAEIDKVLKVEQTYSTIKRMAESL